MNTTQQQSAWGLSKLGKGSTAAMAHAIPLGLAFAVLVAIIAWRPFGADPSWVRGIVFFAAMIAPGTIMAWILILRPGTQKGALKRPAESVERAWSREAGSVAFAVLVGVAGLSLFVSSLLPAEIGGAMQVAALTVLVLGWVTYLVTWFVLKRRG